MSATARNPKLPGALSLAELIERSVTSEESLPVCIVNIEDKTFIEARVVQTRHEGYPVVTISCDGKLENYDAQSIGVVGFMSGAWANYCLTLPDNPALEEFENTTKPVDLHDSWNPHRTLTGAWYSFEKDDGR